MKPLFFVDFRDTAGDDAATGSGETAKVDMTDLGELDSQRQAGVNGGERAQKWSLKKTGLDGLVVKWGL